MPLIHERYTFESNPPSLSELHGEAEGLGRLPIKTSEIAAGIEFEFDFLEGEVSIRRVSDAIILSAYPSAAPVLFELTCKSLELLGGRSESGCLVEIDLPLTEESVRAKTAEYHQELKRLTRIGNLKILAYLSIAISIVCLVFWVTRH